MRLVLWPVIRLLLSATHRSTVHLFDRISLIFGPLQFLRRTPLMLSPAPEIKAAFEHAPAPALAPFRRRLAENSGACNSSRTREQQSIGRVEVWSRGDSFNPSSPFLPITFIEITCRIFSSIFVLKRYTILKCFCIDLIHLRVGLQLSRSVNPYINAVSLSVMAKHRPPEAILL